MNLAIESHESQSARWPETGRVILAQFDDESVIVYQAYNRAIGCFAAEHGYFGGGFRLGRMTWIKPNFLWMMYRSGWGTKPDQEVTLAIRLQRQAFEQILRQAVHSSFQRNVDSSESEWKQALASSDVRLQWDPDHAPGGRALQRRALQLGLRGQTLASYARDWIVEIEDISDFVAEQRGNLANGQLMTPREEVFPVDDSSLAGRLRIA